MHGVNSQCRFAQHVNGITLLGMVVHVGKYTVMSKVFLSQTWCLALENESCKRQNDVLESVENCSLS